MDLDKKRYRQMLDTAKNVRLSNEIMSMITHESDGDYSLILSSLTTCLAHYLLVIEDDKFRQVLEAIFVNILKAHDAPPDTIAFIQMNLEAAIDMDKLNAIFNQFEVSKNVTKH